MHARALAGVGTDDAHNDSQIPRLRHVPLRPLTRSTFDAPVASVPGIGLVLCRVCSCRSSLFLPHRADPPSTRADRIRHARASHSQHAPDVLLRRRRLGSSLRPPCI